MDFLVNIKHLNDKTWKFLNVYEIYSSSREEEIKNYIINISSKVIKYHTRKNIVDEIEGIKDPNLTIEEVVQRINSTVRSISKEGEILGLWNLEVSRPYKDPIGALPLYFEFSKENPGAFRSTFLRVGKDDFRVKGERAERVHSIFKYAIEFLENNSLRVEEYSMRALVEEMV